MEQKDKLIIQETIAELYKKQFGDTPLSERLNIIQREVTELINFTSVRNLREELGDVMSALIALSAESGWDVFDILEENINKISSPERTQQYQSMGRKKQVGILGGAFNPVTRGHMQIAQHVLDEGIVDVIWLMPCYEHMYGKVLEPAEQRIKMCLEAIDEVNDHRITISRYEIDNKLAGESYQLAKRLQSDKDSRYQFSMIIGQDNALTFDKWMNSVELRRIMRFIVVPREGEAALDPGSWVSTLPHIYLPLKDGKKIIDCSSTAVRTALAEKFPREEIIKLTFGNVYDRIINRRLYNTGIPNVAAGTLDGDKTIHRLK